MIYTINTIVVSQFAEKRFVKDAYPRAPPPFFPRILTHIVSELQLGN